MKTEKLIRSQAKDALKGNWIAAISGLFVLAGVILALTVLAGMLEILTGVVVGDSFLFYGNELTIVIILCLTFILAFALSPFKNGYFRLCYNIACGRSDGLRDIFYFFSGTKKYFKTLGFNILLMLNKALYAILGFIPYFVFVAFRVILFSSASSANDVLDVSQIVIMWLCIILTAIISIRLLIVEFVYVDNFEANVFVIAGVIRKKHLGDYYKLVFSFVFWIASCLFVLPGMYVIPYFTTSLGMTSKWLINLYKEGKTV